MTTGKNNKCVISFANAKGNYIKGLSRLSQSLRNNFDGDFLGFIHEQTIPSPLHEENPYAFKVYAIQKAIDMGYSQILWLDSSCFAVAPLQPIFDHIDKHGYIMQEAGHLAGTWTNDATLEYFKVSRDKAMDIVMYGNAGFLGLNTESKTAIDFFGKWQLSMLHGMFKGAWNNNDKTESQDDRCKGHRHDMSCGSIIAHQLGMGLQKGDEWLQYAGPYDKVLNETILLKAQGL